MAIPTRAEVETFAQGLLGDPTGQVFTAAVLADQLGAAFREMYSDMDRNQVPRAKMVGYYNLPAYVGILTPATMGITDFGDIIKLQERDIGSSAAITNATNASPIVVTAASHGFSSNSEIEIHGVAGNTAANGRHLITVVDSNSFSLNGTTGNAAYVSGGTATRSADTWRPVEQTTEIPQRDIADNLSVYVWEEDTFKFVGATKSRQLKLQYFSSGTLPASGSLGVDDCKNFLGFRTAALTGPTYGWFGPADKYDAKADKYLFDLIQQQVRAMQRNPIRPRPYQSGSGQSLKPNYVFIPASGVAVNWWDEIPSGAINGTTGSDGNATFGVSAVPATSFQLFKNGLLQASGTDYTRNGQTITFLAGSIPVTGDTLRAVYNSNA